MNSTTGRVNRLSSGQSILIFSLGKTYKLAEPGWELQRTGKFSAITNFRDLKNLKTDAPSRGKLTLDFLLSNISPQEYYAELLPKLNDYNGFNLLLGTTDELFYFSNVTNGLQKIESGIHGISNAILNTPWPKVEKGKQQLQKLNSAVMKFTHLR